MQSRQQAAFLVTRPIQYLNAVNIPDIEGPSTLLIVNSFSNADALVAKANMDTKQWKNVFVFRSVKEAIFWLKSRKHEFTDFFTFSDFGTRLCLMLWKLKPLRVHLYEEGAGTYVRDVLFPGSIRFLASLLLSGQLKQFRHMGECRFVETIYVNHLELHRHLFPKCRARVKSFRTPLMEHLMKQTESPNFSSILPDESRHRDAILYLSDWTINESVFEILKSNSNHLSIAKLHPAYAGKNILTDRFSLILDTSIFAEIAIAAAVKHFKSLTVVHECSSATLNCKLAGIEFQDINLGSAEPKLAEKFAQLQSAIEELVAGNRHAPTSNQQS